ncbi:unnamed protein product [Mytilus edulis]|uniref:Uncharacterized protein n=1 Tax=Mytilus edulis TaxID=6550 RepID=A0A8S3UM93_MYTED|nr:unnamed protein product [Mytilus edulis]
MTSFTSGIRKKQVRFQTKDDLVLLREVLAKNPFQNKSAWNEIASAVADTRSNLQVDARRVRERTHLLIDQHKKSNADSLKSSGIDEEYGEKETLLDEILSLVEDEEKQKEKQKEKKETEENRGKEIRKRAMENLTPKKGTYFLSYNMSYLCSVQIIVTISFTGCFYLLRKGRGGK